MARGPADFRAQVRFLTTAEGGRKSPVKSGYRGQLFYDGRNWDAVYEFGDNEWITPGEIIEAEIHMLSPQCHVGRLVLDKEFEIREGSKTVAKGKVTKLINLGKS